jgi:hypothetical protein
MKALARGINIPVYSADRRSILCTVSNRCTSIGAAKASGARSCYFAFINNRPAWVIV